MQISSKILVSKCLSHYHYHILCRIITIQNKCNDGHKSKILLSKRGSLSLKLKKRRYAVGAESGAAMTDLQKKLMTCAVSDEQSCEAPCATDASGACHLPETELVKLMFGELKEGGVILFLDTTAPQSSSSRYTLYISY